MSLCECVHSNVPNLSTSFLCVFYDNVVSRILFSKYVFLLHAPLDLTVFFAYTLL